MVRWVGIGAGIVAQQHLPVWPGNSIYLYFIKEVEVCFLGKSNRERNTL